MVFGERRRFSEGGLMPRSEKPVAPERVRLRVGKCFVDALNVGKRLRSIDPEKVAALQESIGRIGLQQPISVWSPDDDTLDLVAGRHRFEAVKKARLGRDLLRLRGHG